MHVCKYVSNVIIMCIPCFAILMRRAQVKTTSRQLLTEVCCANKYFYNLSQLSKPHSIALHEYVFVTSYGIKCCEVKVWQFLFNC